ncbi:hypothetical protein M433DRAFT_537347 [Acidomyces richmondensis BFW]|nr:hypothetical protein M433DRAFT_537347 [Acidomyces richmondensis BFW]
MINHQKVLAIDPSVHDFYCQFYSLGIGHCGGGTGVVPMSPIGQLRAWVENGTAPEYLYSGNPYAVNASSSETVNGTNVRFMNLCPYPLVNKYKGNGDPAMASSYECALNKDGWTFQFLLEPMTAV